MIFAASILMPRHSLGSSQIKSRMKMTIRTRKSQGWLTAAQMPPMTMMSSTMEAVQLVNGSGEALISSRDPALAP